MSATHDRSLPSPPTTDDTGSVGQSTHENPDAGLHCFPCFDRLGHFGPDFGFDVTEVTKALQAR